MPMLDSTTVMDLYSSLPPHAGDVHGLAVSDNLVATTSGAKDKVSMTH